MNIRTRMMYKALFLWQRRGRKWIDGRWVKHGKAWESNLNYAMCVTEKEHGKIDRFNWAKV